MIINLRGPNGSGKSTVAHALLSAGVRARLDYDGVPATVTEDGVSVLGPYRTQCGGMDAVKTQAACRDAVLQVGRTWPRLFFEGVIVSTIFGPWLELSRRLAEERPDGHGITWAFLDTPLETCLERIAARNGGKPIKQDLVRAKYDTIRRVASKAADAGERVVWVPHADPLNFVREMWGLPRMEYDPTKPPTVAREPAAPAARPQADLFQRGGRETT